jgi:hypothetical protein
MWLVTTSFIKSTCFLLTNFQTWFLKFLQFLHIFSGLLSHGRAATLSGDNRGFYHASCARYVCVGKDLIIQLWLRFRSHHLVLWLLGTSCRPDESRQRRTEKIQAASRPSKLFLFSPSFAFAFRCWYCAKVILITFALCSACVSNSRMQPATLLYWITSLG